MIYIIADDLTGATDTGVQLSEQGYNTTVSITNYSVGVKEKQSLETDCDVYVIDSETRDKKSVKAREIISNLFNNLVIDEEDIIYKKIDSTLRGNISTEIETILKILGKDICIFTPAFPSNNRIVVGNYLIVNEKPIGLSEYYEGKLEPGEASYIPNYLKKQTKLPVGNIDLKYVIKGEEAIYKKIKNLYQQGKKIIVIDAINDQHLENIVKGGSRFKGSILYSGSAGLASYIYLAHDFKNKNRFKFKAKKNNDTFLIVGGSKRKIMEKQIEYLKDKEEIFDIKFNVNEILNNEIDINSYINKISSVLENTKYILIRPDPVFNGDSKLHNILEMNEVGLRELEVIIRNFLGEFTSKIITHCDIKNLILTGGDTSLGVCKALGINNLKILYEILPGVAVSEPVGDLSRINIITKAGGFGKEDTLFNIINDFNKLEVKGKTKPETNEKTNN